MITISKYAMINCYSSISLLNNIDSTICLTLRTIAARTKTIIFKGRQGQLITNYICFLLVNEWLKDSINLH